MSASSSTTEFAMTFDIVGQLRRESIGTDPERFEQNNGRRVCPHPTPLFAERPRRPLVLTVFSL